MTGSPAECPIGEGARGLCRRLRLRRHEPCHGCVQGNDAGFRETELPENAGRSRENAPHSTRQAGITEEGRVPPDNAAPLRVSPASASSGANGNNAAKDYWAAPPGHASVCPGQQQQDARHEDAWSDRAPPPGEHCAQRDEGERDGDVNRARDRTALGELGAHLGDLLFGGVERIEGRLERTALYRSLLGAPLEVGVARRLWSASLVLRLVVMWEPVAHPFQNGRVEAWSNYPRAPAR